MQILITGGCGFVGSHLSKYLLEKGHKVVAYDNFSNSKKNENSLQPRVIKGDILDLSHISKCLEKIDLVIHLAAQISVIDSNSHPEKTLKINVQGTENVLNACVKQQVKNFIGISSAAVFGNQNNILSENSPTLPISVYGKSKLLMEKMIVDFSKNHNINSVILRFFNLYGKNQSPQYAGVIAKFLDKIKNCQPVVICGDGSQTRDFVHVDDAISCIDLAIQKMDGKSGEIYNVGSGQSTKILDLAKLLICLSKKNIPISFLDPIENDIIHSRTSIELASDDLGYVPKRTLQDGLSELLEPSAKNSHI